MISQIKRLVSPDVSELEGFNPTRAESFGILIEIFIGEPEEIAEDRFQIYVCTPLWLSENFDKVLLHFDASIFLCGRGFLLTKYYVYEDVKKEIYKLFDGVSGKDWREISQKLSMLSWWEFDN